MIEPVGAVMVHSVEVELTGFQKLESDFAGAFVETCAGIAVLMVVSDTSFVLWEPSVPNHSTEQVAVEPWDAGGVQILMDLSLTEEDHGVKKAVAVVHIVPHAPDKDWGVMAVAVPTVERNL